VVVLLPPFPTRESLYARLATARARAQRLLRLKLSRPALQLARQALYDLKATERLLQQDGASGKPHTLRAADACLDVAQWRLRGVERLLDAEPD
jgi:hypothetical protein